VAADALVLKVREGGRVVNVHALVATGVNADRHREILGVAVTSAEDGSGWLAFLRDLTDCPPSRKRNRLRARGKAVFPVRAGPDRMPGRPGALLRPAPLRTGLARFPRIRLKQARADLLPQTPYVLPGGPPINGVPVQGFVLRSVHHRDNGHRGLRPASRLRRHGV